MRIRRAFFAAPPQVERDIGDKSVNKGEMLKMKIPFSGTGPFNFNLKKGNRKVPESDRVKIIPYDDYVIVQIKGSFERHEVRNEFASAFFSCLTRQHTYMLTDSPVDDVLLSAQT